MTVRDMVAGVLVLVGSLAVLAAVPVIWAGQELRTEGYAETAGPLIKDPEIQAAIATRVTDDIRRQADLPKIVDGTVDALAGLGIPRSLVRRHLGSVLDPTEAALAALIEKDVRETLDSPVATQVWATALRDARNAIATGSPRNAPITVELTPLVEEAKRRLVDDGFDAVRDVRSPSLRFVVVESAPLAEAQRWYDVVAILGVILPVIAAGSFLVALAASPSRRTLLAVLAGTTVAMGVLVLGITMAREPTLASLAPDQRVLGEAAYDAFAASLRVLVWWVFGIALGLAFIVRSLPDRRDSRGGVRPAGWTSRIHDRV
ncbi:hypothetical protein ABN034_07080 [Actinopolymorpha sp. B11F2]|uniref:hypothetical protein n=1 Tax=Actinopolymorpha sp. B11F2 TaxID=3160862 RepID=UPI0032E47A5F